MKQYDWALLDGVHVRIPLLTMEFDGLLEPGLNGPKGLIREHFRLKMARQRRLAMLVFEKLRGMGGRPVGAKWPCRIRYTRYYSRQPMDSVNLAASFKHLEDVLVRANVIPDDRPEIVSGFFPTQVKVKKKPEERTVVEFIHDPDRLGWR